MQPTRVIAVDWSGARNGEQHKIWLAEIAAGSTRAEGAHLVRLCNGWTREAVTEALVRVVHESRARGERTVIGLDFSFGFPAWYARQNGWRSGRDIWSAWTAERVEQTLSQPAFPFWGRGAQRAKPTALHDASDTPPLRATERDSARVGPRPFSVFQLVGAGAVGVGSLRGMATLRALGEAGAVIWPFDAVQTAETAKGPEARMKEGGDAVVLEIWPRLYAPEVNKSSADARVRNLRGLGVWEGITADSASVEAEVRGSDDAFDALMGALALWGAREELAGLPLATDDVERLEGRIWRPALPVT